MVTLAAAFTVFGMTQLRLPVSTTQAIFGAILGWNLFAGAATDGGSLVKIVVSWGVSIALTGALAAVLYLLFRAVLRRLRIHLLILDAYTRLGLILVGAFGAYSLGANNIANVMGVFVPVVPFRDVEIAGLFTLTGVHQLFLLGGLAIAVGVFTYSHKVIGTVGNDLLKITPLAGFVVVLASSLVLFVFSSQALEGMAAWAAACRPSRSYPSRARTPSSAASSASRSSSEFRNIRYRVLGEIWLGWLATPIIAGAIAFFGLFVLQNVFDQEVYRPAAASAIIREAVPPGAKTIPVCDKTGEAPVRPGGTPEDRRPEGTDHE
ncbi:MAG: inorganic phosphate transporter [Candidatus Moduliflexus flocculans]|nr:inorganic phosphate transporter [Candidatus Moduliflexus flocculans]